MQTRKLVAALGIAIIGLTGAAQAHQDHDRGRGAAPELVVRVDLHDGHHDRRGGDARHFARHVDKRQSIQHERIREGWRNGDLTRAEYRQLNRQQKRIERMEQRYTADGRLTARERHRLDKALDHASREIRAARHDDDGRGGHRGNDRIAFGGDYWYAR